jgi:hypothetical protein
MRTVAAASCEAVVTGTRNTWGRVPKNREVCDHRRENLNTEMTPLIVKLDNEGHCSKTVQVWLDALRTLLVEGLCFEQKVPRATKHILCSAELLHHVTVLETINSNGRHMSHDVTL